MPSGTLLLSSRTQTEFQHHCVSAVERQAYHHTIANTQAPSERYGCPSVEFDRPRSRTPSVAGPKNPGRTVGQYPRATHSYSAKETEREYSAAETRFHRQGAIISRASVGDCLHAAWGYGEAGWQGRRLWPTLPAGAGCQSISRPGHQPRAAALRRRPGAFPTRRGGPATRSGLRARSLLFSLLLGLIRCLISWKPFTTISSGCRASASFWPTTPEQEKPSWRDCY